jgi:hypothetical protein
MFLTHRRISCLSQDPCSKLIANKGHSHGAFIVAIPHSMLIIIPDQDLRKCDVVQQENVPFSGCRVRVSTSLGDLLFSPKSRSLELYFKDNRSLLVVCASRKRRQEIGDSLAEKIAIKTQNDSKSPLLFRTPLIGKASAKYMVNVSDELCSAQRRWQAREISNVSVKYRIWRSKFDVCCESSHILAFLTSLPGGHPWTLHSILSSVRLSSSCRPTYDTYT